MEPSYHAGNDLSTAPVMQKAAGSVKLPAAFVIAGSVSAASGALAAVSGLGSLASGYLTFRSGTARHLAAMASGHLAAGTSHAALTGVKRDAAVIRQGPVRNVQAAEVVKAGLSAVRGAADGGGSARDIDVAV